MSWLLISNAKPPLARLCFVLLLFVHISTHTHTHSDNIDIARFQQNTFLWLVSQIKMISLEEGNMVFEFDI